MIERFTLLRNTGQFDNVAMGPQFVLSKTAFIYGENGRGKTTLAAILRSLATNDPVRISERKRLGAIHDPHIIIGVGGQGHTFQNNAWSAPLPEVAIFDDEFIAQNVCSGIEVDAGHRQSLHELILGAQGVALSAALQEKVARIEEHNRALRQKSEALPANLRGTLSADEFCALPAHQEVDVAIDVAERSLAAAREAEAVRRQADFQVLSLPEFDLRKLEALVRQDLPELQKEASDQVKTHFDRLGGEGETWVAEGMRLISLASGDGSGVCPFCVQDLNGSPLIRHYEAYFSEGYASLRQKIDDEISTITGAHGNGAPATFERAVRIAVETQDFWKRFLEIAPIELDTATITQAWNAARDAVLELLRAKLAAPLDRMHPSDQLLALVAEYDRLRQVVSELSERLRAENRHIALVKEQAASADPAVLAQDLSRLTAVRARHTEPGIALCQTYLEEKTAKARTEEERETARAALDNYRENIFPAYQASINEYLGKFNAGFRLAGVGSVNTRAGSACNYNVVINEIEVSPTAAEGPSFRNTLSSGDRNTLALAFFFASLDQNPNLGQRIVVIDDPMTSLDEHRSLTTVQEIVRLSARVAQVIVLSHSKAFLCALWEGSDRASRSSAIVTRLGGGSTIQLWDVNQDSVTAHDRRYELTKAYLLAGNQADARRVAEALRSMLESFLRVAYPPEFPPGSLIGANFLPKCRQQVGTPDEIISLRDIDELDDILGYANRFHHDTNPAYATEIINDQELAQFAARTLRFMARR